MYTRFRVRLQFSAFAADTRPLLRDVAVADGGNVVSEVSKFTSARNPSVGTTVGSTVELIYRVLRRPRERLRVARLRARILSPVFQFRYIFKYREREWSERDREKEIQKEGEVRRERKEKGICRDVEIRDRIAAG